MALTIDEKNEAIQLHINGISCTSISEQLNRSRRAIYEVISGWKKGIIPTPKLRQTIDTKRLLRCVCHIHFRPLNKSNTHVCGVLILL